MDIKRIEEMEARLDRCAAAVKALNESMDALEKLMDDFIDVSDYYGSEEWYDDREGDVPENVKAGVLSEDLPYDMIMDVRDAAFRMLETATEILKNRM